MTLICYDSYNFVIAIFKNIDTKFIMRLNSFCNLTQRKAEELYCKHYKIKSKQMSTMSYPFASFESDTHKWAICIQTNEIIITRLEISK